MSKVFISYSRHSGAIARSLAGDMEALGHTVWFDQELSGGQIWWDRILATIRDCDAVALVLDQDTLNSTACQLEYGYAADLGKPILPLLAADNVSTNLLPRTLSLIQYVDYRTPDRDAALRLARAFTGLPAARPLPDPLPVPPEAPLSYLGTLGERISKVAPLSYEEQSALVVDLKRALHARDTGDDARTLLRQLRSRRDLFAAIAEEIDSIGSQPDPVVTPQAAPSRRPEKAQHTSPGVARRIGDAFPPRLRWAGAGAAAGMTLVSLAIELSRYAASDWPALIVVVGAFPWAIAGAIARGRVQPTTLAFIAAAFGAVLAGTMGSGRWPLVDGMVLGAAPGVILGAIAGAVIERRRAKV